jgi:3-oxoacyl-[acyl-carrier protein] reductase
MDLGLKDRVAVVTGAAGGIGRACVSALVAEGCRVVATDLDQAGLADVEDPRISTIAADLSDPDGPGRAIDHAMSHFGELHVLVCAGGVFGTARGGIFAGPDGASTILPDQWDHTLAVNLRGSFLAAQAAIPHMAEAGWGRVVVIGSVSGQMGGFGAGADYAASKAGLGGMVRSLSLTAGPLGITVNCVNPGMIETPMLTDNHGTQNTDQVRDRSAMRRLGNREELAALVVMLTSEQAGFVTGSHLDVNGGFYLG